MVKLITEHIDIWTAAQTQKTNGGRGRGKNSNGQSPHGIKKLRELILELAVRGKLVAQDPNDVPASVLLEKIAKEKARLIKEGKIKKQEPLPEIGEDEKPFELPKGWEWVKLGNLVSIQTGRKDVNEGNENGIYPFFSCAATALKSDNYSFDCEALLLPGNGANVGLVTYYKGKFEAYQRTYVLNDFIKIVPRYIEKSLNAKFLKTLEGKQYGSAINYIKIGNLLGFIFSLPPLAEQHRIVAKVDELMALCDQLEQQQIESNDTHKTLVETLLATLTNAADQTELAEAWQCIATHFETLFTTEQSIDQLKQTILQLAVMGKLVPQDPNDEPASTLLDKIAEEKTRLIKEGKIKKQKILPDISEGEKPFELPAKWEWTRLGTISLINPRNEADDDTSASFVPMSLITTSYTGEHDQEERTWGSVKQGYTHFANGDIGLAKITPCFENSKAAVFSNLKNGIGAGTTELHISRPLGKTLYARYVLIYLKAPHFLLLGEKKMTGTAGQKRVPKNFFTENPFPLPPLTEQYHIVAKVDELMALCGTLKARLNESQTIQVQLADAIVKQAVA